jgi:hypothetical protein
MFIFNSLDLGSWTMMPGDLLRIEESYESLFFDKYISKIIITIFQAKIWKPTDFLIQYPETLGLSSDWDPIKLRFFHYISSLIMFFIWYHKKKLWTSNISETIFPKKYWNQLVVALILRINNSHLEKQEKKSSEEVVTQELIVRLDIINQKIIAPAGPPGHTGRTQPICFKIAQICSRCTKYMCTTTFGSPTLKICFHYSIKRWSFLSFRSIFQSI